jgi:hypothetical protein
LEVEDRSEGFIDPETTGSSGGSEVGEVDSKYSGLINGDGGEFI